MLGILLVGVGILLAQHLGSTSLDKYAVGSWKCHGSNSTSRSVTYEIGPGTWNEVPAQEFHSYGTWTYADGVLTARTADLPGWTFSFIGDPRKPEGMRLEPRDKQGDLLETGSIQAASGSDSLELRDSGSSEFGMVCDRLPRGD